MDALETPLVFLQTCLCTEFDRLPEEFVEREECDPLSTQTNPIALPLYYLEQVHLHILHL